MAVITSANAPHYVAFGDLGWLWVRSYSRAHEFASKAEAKAWAQENMPDMLATDSLWFLS